MRTKFGSIALAAAMAAVFIAPAHAQRLSLAERVAKLEQEQGQGGAQANIQLVNQINALQSQLQNLQGQIEELRHQVDELKSHGKDQYIDLDSRIGRLEGRNPGTAPAAVAPAIANGAAMQDVQLGNPQSAPAPGQAAPTPTPAATLPGMAAATPAAPAPAATAPPADAAAAPPVAPQAPAQDPKTAYDTAFSALKDGRYAESARLFQAFIMQFPNDELTPNAYYWLGESYYVTQNYPVSMDTFRKLLAQFPNSQKAPDALLKVGYCQYELKQWDQAQATLNQVLQQYPNTTVANLAQGRLRALRIESQQR
ncbi:MAG: tol-pal system protein YbgF [Proteobacteria bacterium]|nr:tol-pal system protein YbgF [Pseudomonadota bacterium]